MMAQRIVRLRRFLGATALCGVWLLPLPVLARVSRGPVGSATATARSRGVGAAAATRAGFLGAAASAASLCSIPSLLTGLVSREVTADAVDTADDAGVHSASG